MTKAVFKTTGKSADDFQVRFKAGDTIFREGELGTEMYVVQSGTVEIVKPFLAQDQQLAVLEKGDFFGEMALLEDLPRSATARALSDVKLLAINGATFDQLLRDNPEIAVRMMRKLSRRLRETDRLLQQLSDSSLALAVPEMPPLEARPARQSASAEVLTHADSGLRFSLAPGAETTLGRRDPVTGIQPDIDLTPIDSQRSTSRRHAKILRQGDEFAVVEEIGTVNGTFVNGKRCDTGVEVPVSFGDRLRFGTIELILRRS
ncbi:MAG TPA: cyclic nucleotide-binding domain-containing protein [Thermoanaerobaculia bacterium]|nr:cyclic nucleotide-binding domain-containing protein [Thermoanaerobaculia bacterium]